MAIRFWLFAALPSIQISMVWRFLYRSLPPRAMSGLDNNMADSHPKNIRAETRKQRFQIRRLRVHVPRSSAATFPRSSAAGRAVSVGFECSIPNLISLFFGLTGARLTLSEYGVSLISLWVNEAEKIA
jgi:hypothetical protein